jgi:hypothetical protein
MRIFILFCVFFISILSFTAQSNFNRAYHGINEICNPFIIEIGSNIFYTTQNIDATNFGFNHLYNHSASGNLIFNQTLSVPSKPLLGLKSLDNQLILVGGSPQCDVVPPTQTNYLTKLNTTGTTIFQSTFTTNSFDNPKACIQALDSSYFIFTDSSFIKISKAGQLIFKITSGLSEVSSALLLANNNFLVSAKILNMPSFVTLAPTGTIVNTVSTNKLYSQLSFYVNQKIMARGVDGKLYKFSSGINIIASSNLSTGQSFGQFVLHNDTLHCLLTSSVALSSYGVCDTAFSFFSNISTSTQKLSQKALAVISTNKVAILNEGEASINNSFVSNSSIHRYAGLSVIDKYSSNNFNYDLALLDVVSDSAYAICTNTSLSPTLCRVFLRAKIKVKNLGNGIVTSFKLNCYEYPHVACGVYFYQQQFSQLSLKPGDSITVLSNRFIERAYITPTSSITQTPFCFYVSVPNNEVDKTLNDNELCKSFNFITTGLKENEKLNSVFKIFPNPFNNELKIESNEQILNYKLIDVFGKILFTGNADNKTFNLKTENLIQGIYFLKVETEKGIITKKIVKE